MSTSLLLALLESQEKDESDYSAEYKRLATMNPQMKKLMLERLYEVLQQTLVMGTSQSDALGTVLARTLSDEPSEGLAQAKSALRSTLKYEMDRRFRELKGQYPIGSHTDRSSMPSTGPYPIDRSTQPIGEALHGLLDLILQRMR